MNRFALFGTALLLAACSAPEPLTLATPQGELRGEVSKSGVANFKGIPYAQAPVGDMRWRPPGPAPRWDGVREATAFSPTCMQSTEATGDLLDRVVEGHGLGRVKRFLINRVAAGMDSPPTSEDCLYLNVRTPDAMGSAPVMVWIHGGGHQFGSADFDLYQGDALAERGVVLVTLNYRLNAFGYLAHPLLSADDPDGVSGNYGLRDQIKALEWVRDTIAAFGGDPGNVTVFGESAGASSAAALIASPLANGLFQRAVLQSGESTRALVRLDAAERVGEAIVAAAGGGASAAELRALSADAILRAAGAEDRSASLRPIGDGVVLAASVAEVLASGDFRPVPAIVGYNADEAGIFYSGPEDAGLHADLATEDAAEQLARLQAGYGEVAGAAIAELYGFDGPARHVEDARDLMGDELFGVSARFVMEWLEARGADVWAYAFTRVPPSPRQTIGAFHSSEIPFIFGTHEAILGLSNEDEALTERMQDYWVNFARTGDPNGQELPTWPRYGGMNWMEFTANTDRSGGVLSDYRKAKLDALSAGLDPALGADTPR